jgi:NADPH-dependent curcumin reductase CurA
MNQRIVLAARPSGLPKPADFRLEEVPIPQPADGEVLLRIQYLSLDPYMRGRMDDRKSYSKPTALGEPMEGGTVAVVLESRMPEFKPGDTVLSHSGWQSHAVAKPVELRKLDPKAAPVTTALGVLGMPGFTAYAGLLTIGQPK